MYKILHIPTGLYAGTGALYDRNPHYDSGQYGFGDTYCQRKTAETALAFFKSYMMTENETGILLYSNEPNYITAQLNRYEFEVVEV